MSLMGSNFWPKQNKFNKTLVSLLDLTICSSPIRQSSKLEIMLHAFWLPDSYVVNFWLEEDEETDRPVTALAHPRNCSYDVLTQKLPERLQAFEPEHTRYLDTPIFGDRPAGPDDVVSGNLELRRYKIATAESLTDDAVEYLLGHSVRTHVADELQLAPSLQYWRVLTDFSQYLVDERLYMPGVIDMQQKYYGSWRAVIPPDLEDRWAQLANSVPGICRNFCLDDELENCRNPELLALSFIDACVDHLVRHHLGMRPPAAAPKGKGKSTLPRQWVAQLRKPVLATELRANNTQLTGFASQVNKWNAGMRPMPGETGLRVGFRMISPQEANEIWRLEFMLCSIRDPSIRVEADEVWSGKPQESVGNAILPEVILGGLGTASATLPALSRALADREPAYLEMSKAEAMEFLDGTVAALEKEGFPVILPPWLRSSQKALGLRVKIAPRSGITYDREHVLGVDQLVSYHWQVSVGDTILTEDEFRQLAESKSEIVYHGGKWMRLDAQVLQNTVKIMDENGTSGEATLAGALEAGLAMPAKGGLPILDIQVQGDIGRLFNELKPGDGFEILPVPDGLVGTLRDYQVVGFSWMWFLRQLGFGACLADDMGLGKTIQTITLLLRDHVHNAESNGTSLVVCPMSVVGNWEREFQRFSPSLRVRVHHGTDRVVYDQFLQTLEESDVIITTYTLLVRDQLSFLRTEWRNIVLDEAQNIKNPATKQTIAARSLKGAFRFCLTGTPVENRLTELWSIMEFLNPGYLGDLGNFRANFALPIERGGDHEQLALLRKIVKPFILRRLKTDRNIIRDLPEKQEMKVYCNLTTEQATLYQEVVDNMLEKLAGREGIARKGIVLATLTKLKQITNHPLHFSQNGSEFRPERSGKFQCLEEMLEVVLQEGDKTLIFTQFTQMGKMMEKRLQQHFGVEVFFLHGGTPQWQRDDMVNRFQRDGGPPIFILSLKAGGTGLNLTAASHVFHFDRWWNPAVEDQATDRAYRIGQTRNVQVHKLISIGTVEEKVDQMIEQKKELATNIIPSGEQLIVNLSTEQLRDIFSLSSSAVSE